MTHITSRLSTAHLVWRTVTAILAGVAAIAGSFAYAGLTPAFVGDPAASFVVDSMPAAIVNAVRDAFGPLAQPASFLLALLVVAALFAATVLLALEIEVLADRRYLAVALAAVAVWLVATAATGAPVAAVAAAVPAAAVVAVVELAAVHDPLSVRRVRERLQSESETDAQARTVDRTKRATLQAGFGTLSFAGIAALVGQRRTPGEGVPALETDEQGARTEQQLLDDAADAALDLPDAPGLVSEIGAFYTVDINTIDPILERGDWALSITGAVDSELTIDYDALREREAERFYGTLRCVGEDLNDREMDTAVWTGVPVADLLEEVGPGDEATHVVAHAVDDYWNTITREALERSYLVYGMNGRFLPREHGHPVRLFVPGNWGEVNVKWLDELEFVREERDGYWEERGWDGTGEVETVTKLWSVDHQDDAITVGGHAYAGLEGVDAVEVSIDGGETWTAAELSPEPDAGTELRDVWRQWRYSFEPAADRHEVVVRAIDGTGAVQTEDPSGPKPDGATGWVSKTIEP
ncbi:molybdopterin-dependent oxidoreductase [Halopiger aswanensis]|uniref:DMSO/TMAO reductase YedYZ molybdopterin-dependent catalytic subunit n=1 Tax=Halopiger aswanensis TaxID=148449 RepID=A0A3R7HX43_9EURY|nr:molybdopterin-dependent oxidoreductase [Halopiger aswanensis]RKD94023.1 DMSO/TMAO reductase YedYZ molybdopterin-dependent catalytic subunit [Halopiger aswanensis]